MLSTLLELLGFAALTYAALLLGGQPAAFIVGGGALLLIGYGTEDKAAVFALDRALAPARSRVAALKQWRQDRRATRTAAKAG